jgi:hypothetical protein
MEIVLALRLTLELLYLRAGGLTPLCFHVVLCLVYTVCAVRGIFVLGECGCRCVELRFEAVDVRLHLLNLRRHICLIVRVQVWCDIRSPLQVRLAKFRRVVRELRHRGRTSEGYRDNQIPYAEPVRCQPHLKLAAKSVRQWLYRSGNGSITSSHQHEIFLWENTYLETILVKLPMRDLDGFTLDDRALKFVFSVWPFMCPLG